MFCRKCGIQISDDSIFCYKCGTKVIILDSDKLNNNTDENNSIESDEKCIDNFENSDFENDRLNIDINIKSDKINTNITENSSIENNPQKINISKTDDIFKQNTEQQNINSPNTKPSLEPNKDKNIAIIILLGAIILVIAIIIAITSIIMYTDFINNISNPQNTKTFNDQETGISFTYPKVWTNNFIEENKDDCIVYLVSPGLNNKYSRMSVTKLNTNSDKSSLNNLKYSMSKKSSNNENEVEKIIDTTIDGIDAIKITYGEEYERIAIQYVYVLNRDMYLITFSSPVSKIDKNESLFNAIMETYTITR